MLDKAVPVSSHESHEDKRTKKLSLVQIRKIRGSTLPRIPHPTAHHRLAPYRLAQINRTFRRMRGNYR